MKNELDNLLKQALTPQEEPGKYLNEKLRQKIREETEMAEKKKHRNSTELTTAKRRPKRLRPAMLLTAVLILILCSATAFAAWKYLSPRQIAEETGYDVLGAAFESEDAVSVNETRNEAGYQITLLGIVSGKNLTGTVELNGQTLENDSTYAVVAIEHSDGTPMPDTSSDEYGKEEFFVSPFVKGLNPKDYNAFTMGGGYSDMVKDGIMYRIAECDNVEIFADRGLYLCVQSGTFPDVNAYRFDESSGEISESEDYEGLNILFSLPVDTSKADPAAAEEYLKQMTKEENGAEIPDDAANDAIDDGIEEFMEKVTGENIDEYCEPVESTRQVLTPDADNNIDFTFEVEGRGGGEGKETLMQEFLDSPPGTLYITGWSDNGEGLDGLLISTLTLLEDGKVEFVAYIPKT